MKPRQTFSEYTKSLMVEETAAPVDPTEPPAVPLEQQNLSLDLKVDSYLMKYEKESLPTQQSYAVPGTDLGMVAEARGFARYALGLLKEAEGDDPMAAGPDAGGGAPGGDDGAGGGGDAPPPSGAPQEPRVENPRFNVKNFAESVARLVLNYESLLDPRTTILNRARAYLEKNYDAGVAQEMMQLLETQFQLSPREPEENDGVVAPPAAGAWTGVGGTSG